MRYLFVVYFCILLLINQAIAKQIIFQSKQDRVMLIELFSSEGCSSCVRADKWQSALKKDKRLFKDFVPITFHVNYWDRLGWVDKYATQEYTNRQYRYIRLWGNDSTPYTPMFVVNGKEHKRWFNDKSLPKDTMSKYGGGILKGILLDDYLDISFVPKKNFKQSLIGDIFLNMAILGMNIQTNVKSGENIGKTLHHDFVVLSFKRISLKKVNGIFKEKIKLINKEHKKLNRSIVIWADTKNMTPLQATGSYLR